MTLRSVFATLSPFGMFSGLALQACTANIPPEGEFSMNGYDPNVPTSSSSPGTFKGTGPEATGLNLDECAVAKGDARKLPVYMQIVLDGSGSMDVNDPSKEADPRDGNNRHGRKWIAAREALVNFYDALAAQGDPHFVVGKYVFETNNKKPSNQVDVPIGVVDSVQAGRLKQRILPPTFGDGGTPLCSAIQNQIPFLKNYTPTSDVGTGGRRVMVIITDGIPSDAGCDTGKVLDIVRGGAADGTKFFAIGVGDPNGSESDYSEKFMGDIAVAGKTQAEGCTPGWNQSSPAGQTPCHMQITPGARTADQVRDDFTAAIDKIRESVGSCEYALERPAGSGELDPAKVNVVLTNATGQDTTILQDSTDGWSYDNPSDPKVVKLNGKSCTDAKISTSSKVRIVVGCVTQVAAPR